jgi:hypothetical protein
MDIHINYVIHEKVTLLGNSDYLGLRKVVFNGWQSNKFKTEEEAIAFLVSEEMTYTDYVILKEVYIN